MDTNPSPAQPAQVSISEARQGLSELVGRARHAGSVTVITSRGKPVAAVVPLSLLQPKEKP